MRFTTDPTQTPNTKVKLATLTYLRCLLDAMDREDLLSSTDTPAALVKILSWTSDQRSFELRRASSSCFVAMFNCNMSAFSKLLQELPAPCQNAASQIIQTHLRRAESLDQSPSSVASLTPHSSGSTPGTYYQCIVVEMEALEGNSKTRGERPKGNSDSDSTSKNTWNKRKKTSFFIWP